MYVSLYVIKIFQVKTHFTSFKIYMPVFITKLKKGILFENRKKNKF